MENEIVSKQTRSTLMKLQAFLNHAVVGEADSLSEPINCSTLNHSDILSFVMFSPTS